MSLATLHELEEVTIPSSHFAQCVEMSFTSATHWTTLTTDQNRTLPLGLMALLEHTPDGLDL